MASTTILDLPFRYTIAHIPRRKRLSHNVNLRGLVPVEIRQLSGDEAPVAIEVIRHEEARAYRATRDVGPVPITVFRAVGDRLFQRLDDDTPISLKKFAEDVGDPFRFGLAIFSAKYATWPQSAYPLTRGQDGVLNLYDFEHWRSVSVQSRQEPFGRIAASDMQERAAEAQAKLAADIVEIDGEVWVACRREPRLVVYPAYDSKELIASWTTGEQSSAHAATYRLDRTDTARAVMFETARDRRVARTDMLPEVKVHIEGMLRESEARHAALTMLRAVELVRSERRIPQHELEEPELLALAAIAKRKDELTDQEVAEAIRLTISFVEANPNISRTTRAPQVALRWHCKRWKNHEKGLHAEVEALQAEQAADHAALAI